MSPTSSCFCCSSHSARAHAPPRSNRLSPFPSPPARSQPRYLATSQATTFLSALATTTTDISTLTNPLVEVQTYEALQVSTYAADSVNPNMLNFTLDLNDGILEFDMDEVVDLATLDVTQIVFQYAIFTGSNEQQYQLTGGSIDSTAPSR